MTPAENELLARLDERLANQGEQLERIEQHVQETNGRVGKLELWRAGLEGARRAMAWLPPLVSAAVSGGLVALLAWALGGAG